MVLWRHQGWHRLWRWSEAEARWLLRVARRLQLAAVGPPPIAGTAAPDQAGATRLEVPAALGRASGMLAVAAGRRERPAVERVAAHCQRRVTGVLRQRATFGAAGHCWPPQAQPSASQLHRSSQLSAGIDPGQLLWSPRRHSAVRRHTDTSGRALAGAGAGVSPGSCSTAGRGMVILWGTHGGWMATLGVRGGLWCASRGVL